MKRHCKIENARIVVESYVHYQVNDQGVRDQTDPGDETWYENYYWCRGCEERFDDWDEFVDHTGRQDVKKLSHPEPQTIEQAREFWQDVADKNGWATEFVQVWVDEKGKITDSVAIRDMEHDIFVDAEADQEITEETAKARGLK